MRNILFRPATLFFSVLVAAGIIYSAGMAGPFLFDDYQNLAPIGSNGGAVTTENAYAYIFGKDGKSFERSVSRASFLFNDQQWPSVARKFKPTNIVLHLFSSLLVWRLLFNLIKLKIPEPQAKRIAVLSAIIWMLHPLHVSTVLYIVQRMTILMHLFLLASLLAYIKSREPDISWSRRFTFIVLASTAAILSFLSKENGILVLPLVFVVEIFFLQAIWPSRLWMSLSAAGAAFFGAVFLYISVGDVDSYDGRMFGLAERFAIQGEILSTYLRYWFFPPVNEMTLFHDDVDWRLQLDGVGWSGLFWVLHLAVLVLAIFKQQKNPLLSFAIIWFYVSHIIESTIISLELMFEHRNYLASVGLAVLAATISSGIYDRLANQKMRSASVVFLILGPSVLAVMLSQRVAQWADWRILASKWAAEHPYSVRAQTNFISMLDAYGLTLMAADTAENVSERLQDLSLALYAVHLHCSATPDHFNEGIVVDLSEIQKYPFSTGVNFQLKKILSIDSECIDKHLRNGDVYDLVKAIADLRLLEKKPPYLAQYMDILADEAIKRGDYETAVKATEKLWIVQPTVDTGLKLAELFILGGDIERAKKMLSWVKERNSESWLKSDLVKKQISNLEIALSRFY